MPSHSESSLQPLVTIITPAYNREGYIAEVLESVLSQDYPRLEYIVLDDGSTDATWDVINRYRDRIVADSHRNMGETATVNKGFAMAHGAIIGVVNSDDPILPHAVRRAVEALESDPDAIVVYPDWNMIDDEGRVLETMLTREYSYLDMLRTHHCVPGPGAFFRRSVVERLGGRDEGFRYVADFEFWLRAGLLGSFRRIPAVLATFRLHASGATTTGKGIAMAEEHIRLVSKIYSLPQLPSEVLAIRSEAFSSANYIAGCVCNEGDWQSKRRFFLAALRWSPASYPTRYRARLLVIGRAFAPAWLRIAKRRLDRMRIGHHR